MEPADMMREVVAFLGSRIPVRSERGDAGMDRWALYADECALSAFILLLVTGVWLTFVFQAVAHGAFASVVACDKTPIGYLVRQVHHWSAVTFVCLIFLRLPRMFFSTPYCKAIGPAWIVGSFLLLLAVVSEYTGDSLPGDALSGITSRIANSLLLSIPVVGSGVADALNDGTYPGPALIQHLALIHTYVLPIAIVVLVCVQFGFAMVAQRGAPDSRPRADRRDILNFVLRQLAAFALTAGVVLALAASIVINPIEIYGPYDAWTVINPTIASPFGAFLDGALRLGPAIELTIAGHPIPAIFWPGILLPLITFIIVLSWPWIELASAGKTSPALAAYRRGIGVAVLAAGAVLTLASGDDRQALLLHQPIQSLITAYRIALPCVSIIAGVLAVMVSNELGARRARRGLEAQSVIQLRSNERGGYDVEPVATT